MKKLFLLLLLFTTIIFAQDKISFEFDYARFKYDSTKTYLEVYYSLGESNLTPYEKDGKLFIGAYIDISITDTLTKESLIDKRYLSQTKLDSVGDKSYIGKNLLGNLGFILNKGVYYLDLSSSDVADSTKMINYHEVITINEFPKNRYALSDIQLATRIVSDSQNKESIFYKNTMEVFPNPVNIYTEKMPILFYYSELYNLDIDKYKDRELVLIQQLNDNYGKAIKTKKKILPKQNGSVVEAGVINLAKYPTGSYTLLLNIFEDSVNIGIASAKRFYLINPSVEQPKQVLAENMDVSSSEFGIMSEEECDELFEVSEPIATKLDIDTYKILKDEKSKRKFLFDFWKRRDQIPETPKNEFKEEYMERVHFVDIRYKTFVKRGVKTDRGRIYLIYGEPDEIDNYPNQYNMKPYEIWYYHSIEGGVEFVFGDITGYNNYELLHSTKRGEIRDDTWARRITVE